MPKTTAQQPTTAQSLGALLKSARDIMRKDKGLNGDLDRLSAFGVASDVPPLQGGGICLGTITWGFARRFTPGYHMMGFQPSHCGPSTCHPFDW